MRKFLTIVTAGIIALLSLNSCDVVYGEFDATSCDVRLTCYYAGGLPAASAMQTYELDGPLRDRDIEDIFNELSSMVQPGFTNAVMDIDFYDWMDNYTFSSSYEFWWEVTDEFSGDGFYAWDEILD